MRVSPLQQLLESRDPALFEGRVGVLCNQTSFDPTSRRYLFEILNERGVLRRLFLPEHGLFAELQDQVALTATTIYAALGLDQQCEIVSLYGTSESTLVVAPEMLADLDTLIVDIQDIGARYYTFATTLSYLIDQLPSQQESLKLIVVDRPNPAGRAVEGSVLPESFASFVGRPGLPHRHGLTLGELALFYRTQAERATGQRALFELEVLRYPAELEGGADFTWQIAPSPNMPTELTPLLYSGQCLLEGTNLSEGRGTTRPFEIFGASWLSLDLAVEMAAMPELMQPGAILRPLAFIPAFHKEAERFCGGFQIHLDRSESYHSLGHTLQILRTLRERCAGFAWRDGTYEFRSDRPAIELLVGDELLLDYLRGEESFSRVREYLRQAEIAWRETSRDYRLYPAALFRVEP